MDRAAAVAVEPVAVGERIHAFASELFPICRSITGRGVRDTLALVAREIGLAVREVPSGTKVLDWEVPDEWNIADAYVKDAAGRRVIDFRRHNLHVMSYSVPVRARLRLEELRPHLRSDPARPRVIPYRTAYYRRDWAFCLAHDDLLALQPGEYEVCIDSTLAPGSLTYGECVVRGASDREILVFTHVCHPSMANDNASGIAVATELVKAWRTLPRAHSLRVVFAPGTIGSITWLAQNSKAALERIDGGLVLGLLGDAAPLCYKQSRRGDAAVDRAARHVFGKAFPGSRVVPFSPYGYDERQLCSPGFNLPVGRLTRSSNDEYPEYHSSADDLDLLTPATLEASLRAALAILEVVDGDAHYVNLSPHGEPQLGRRGLYRAAGGDGLPDREFALLWVLNQSDGAASLLDIAERSGLAFRTIRQAADELLAVGLLDLDQAE